VLVLEVVLVEVRQLLPAEITRPENLIAIFLSDFQGNFFSGKSFGACGGNDVHNPVALRHYSLRPGILVQNPFSEIEDIHRDIYSASTNSCGSPVAPKKLFRILILGLNRPCEMVYSRHHSKTA
jgi:hypothetical protein